MEVAMDQLLPRKPQDVDRWSDEVERDVPADAGPGPQDRWANEAARGDADYPAADADSGGLADVNRSLEEDGGIGDDPTDPLIHGQAR
jgi:hypothetical protein